MDETSNEIIAIITTVKNLPERNISPDVTLESLGISSLEAITIIHEVEDRWDVMIPDEELDKLKTVRDIVVALDRLLQGNG